MFKIKWEEIEVVLSAVPTLLAVWVFGSAKQGVIAPNSDLDIGLLFAQTPSLDILAELRAALQKKIQFEEIGLVVLNHASPLLRFEAISGKAIFCRDKGKRAEFASLTAREYKDEMAMVTRVLRQLSLK